MRAAGVEILAPLDEMAVMGFVEVAARLGYFLDLQKRLESLLASGDIDLLIPIDYPGFNLRMTHSARNLGVPVLYYIAPQVWAWKAHRARRLAEAADAVAVILPFEAPYFEGYRAKVTFVGHPLLEHPRPADSRETFGGRWGLDAERPWLALFPGSREQEIRRHLDAFVDAASRLVHEDPSLQVVVARVSGTGEDSFPPTLPCGTPMYQTSDAAGLLVHARAGILKSGTTTLEAALAGLPAVVAYRTHPLTWEIARRVVRVPHVALANLVAGDRVYPELLQSAMTGAGLATALRPVLNDGPDRNGMLERLAGIRERLGTSGASDRVAGLAAELLAARGF
jgi:lipid-A-disaccharide synthase